jgi:hypothetical protein
MVIIIQGILGLIALAIGVAYIFATIVDKFRNN